MGTVSVEGEVAGARGSTGISVPWWTGVPLDRVVRLHGAPLRDLAESVDPLPAGAPSIAFYVLPAASASRSADAIVGALESAALDLLPRWLGLDDLIGDTSALARSAARERAQLAASTSPHFGPYLAHLAAARVSGTAPRADAFSRETRAAGSARIVAAAHARQATLLVIDVPADADADAIGAAAEWLCANGLGVALMGTGAAAVQRFPSLPVSAGPVPDDVVTVVDRFRPISYPPTEGRPHPASEAELRLCRLLGTHDWAAGRGHNRVLRLGELGQPFTVDVLWAQEKVVVEIDGPEHRARGRFADDRSRDNLLQTSGYMVLRFSNDDIAHDHEQVLTMIDHALHRRRSKGTDT